MSTQPPDNSDDPTTTGPPPSIGRLLRVWFSLGLQSFGGGTATLALIRRTFVDQEKWITDAEFTRNWALVQLVPGINLLALTILIGRRLRGTPGIVVSLAGLLLPSVTVTILLSAGFAHFRQSPLVRDAVRGMIPAIVGLGLLTAFQIVRPLLRESRREGRVSLGAGAVVLIASGAAAAAHHWPIILILVSGGLAMALVKWRGHSMRKSGSI